jgi:hypothetical protein
VKKPVQKVSLGRLTPVRHGAACATACPHTRRNPLSWMSMTKPSRRKSFHGLWPSWDCLRNRNRRIPQCRHSSSRSESGRCPHSRHSPSGLTLVSCANAANAGSEPKAAPEPITLTTPKQTFVLGSKHPCGDPRWFEARAAAFPLAFIVAHLEANPSGVRLLAELAGHSHISTTQRYIDVSRA